MFGEYGRKFFYKDIYPTESGVDFIDRDEKRGWAEFFFTVFSPSRENITKEEIHQFVN